MNGFSDKQPLIILAGPTAVGKTNLSILLAKAMNGEVISADSMQVYRGMDIGTAKIMPEEMQGIRHYMINEFDPKEEFNVTIFQSAVKKHMKEIYAKNKIPILVGGTGFYIQAVLYDIDFTDYALDPLEEEQTHIRTGLVTLMETKGQEHLHQMLQKADPVYASMIHANNKKRVIRALEYYQLTGNRFSDHNKEQQKRVSPYHFYYFVLNDDREKLYRQIDKRVDQMLDMGLVEEVRGLCRQGCNRKMTSMQGLGYKEIMSYLEGEMSLEETVRILKRDTRHFAKRQLTWFRREKEVIWLSRTDYQDDEEILKQIMKIIKADRNEEH